MKLKNLLIMSVTFFIFTIVFTDISICSDTILKNNETINENNSLYSEIILPPDSTSTDLQTAINNAVSGDIIIISSNMECTATVTIPAGKEITIQSNTGNSWILMTTAVVRHFDISGTLILQNIILDGGTLGGGIAVSSTGTFIMNVDTTIQNCTYSGVFNYNGTFTMNNGIIKNNSTFRGGGVYNLGTFTMNDGIIKNNTASSDGGGVYSTSTFTMYGGSIVENSSSGGGGIYSSRENNFTIFNGIISNNHSSGSGGGILLPMEASLTMHNGIISDNTATSNGGRYL